MIRAAVLSLLPVLQAPADPLLAAALDSITAHNVRADIHFVACDAMGGRDTPSLGQRVTARFIRARLERLGFQPGAAGGWFHTYRLDQRAYQAGESAVIVSAGGAEPVAPDLSLGGEPALVYAEDYFLLSANELADLDAEGGVVFCGAGEQADFDGIELAGRWALCADSGISPIKRRNNARNAGALGLLVTQGPGDTGAPYAERFAETVRRGSSGAVSWPSSRAERRPVFPQLFLSRSGAARLLALAGMEGSFPARGDVLDVRVRERRRAQGEAWLENVCGWWPGSDPELADEALIVSAHYDHVGYQGGVLHPGADDNGSGTTGMLQLAEALATYGPLRRSVLLIWVSGEEKGLWGSRAWADEHWLPGGARPVCDINIDMIGRNAPDELLITPTSKLKQYNGLTRLAESLSSREGFSPLGSADDYWSRSDHANFAALGIPVAFLFADVHADYHMPGDTPDKVDCDKVARVTRLVLRMLVAMQADELAL